MLKTLHPRRIAFHATATILLLFFGLTLLTVTPAKAQRFGSVYFGRLPQDYQLYPRDAKSEAKVPVSGVVEDLGWKYVSVQVLRNDQPYQYRRSAIQYTAGKGSFSLDANIKAERANYDFKVFLCKDSDSTLLVTRTRVVSGDVYILSGQSNSTGFFGESDTSMFCRTFGKITDNLNTAPYNPADTLWTLSNMRSYDNGVGTMGLEIQKRLMEQSGIPNCLINAGFHWSSAYAHSRRTESNPADLNNGYGRMLYRAQKAGVAGAVKAYIFRQGESEAYHEGGDWEGNFDILYKYLKMDFPAIQKVYVFQIDIIYWPSLVGALVRDYQRRLPRIYPDIVSLATVGTTGYDGLHYNHEGNQQGGFELSRLMLRDLYASKDTVNITSPDIKKVFYHSAAKTKLTLVFDENQQLKYPEPFKHPSGPVLDMKDMFLLDHQSGAVTGGRAEGNRVILDLKANQNASVMDYLPLWVEQGGPYYPFLGPHITNATGMRAFTFFNVPIATALGSTVLTGKRNNNDKISLTWTAVTGASGYVLERKIGEQAKFTIIARAKADVTQWEDAPEETKMKITYRVLAVSEVAESADYATAEIAPKPEIVLGTEDDLMPQFTVSPNPAVRGEIVMIHFPTAQTGQLTLINAIGQPLLTQKVVPGKPNSLSIPRHISGMHLVQFKKGNRTATKKLWIR